MQKHLFIGVLLVLFIATSSSTCQKHVHNTDPCGDIACTALFAMINVTVTDPMGDKVVLDDAYTIKVGGSDTLRYDQGSSIDGSYIVLDDNYQKKMVNASFSFRFIGIKNGNQVVNELYVIGADCCHINKQSGKTAITIP